jgi:hypothetical protein
MTVIADATWVRVAAVGVGLLLAVKIVVALRAGRPDVSRCERSLRRLTFVKSPGTYLPPRS